MTVFLQYGVRQKNIFFPIRDRFLTHLTRPRPHGWDRAPLPPLTMLRRPPLWAPAGVKSRKNRYRFGNGNPGTQPRRPYIIIYIANGNPRVPTLRIGENLGSRYAMAPNQKSLGKSGRLLVGSQNRFLTQLEPPCESTLGVLLRP